MTIRLALVAAALAALPAAAAAQSNYAPPYEQLGRYRARGENPCFHVDEYGHGNYVRGPNGSFGCYPAGSAGAIELENEQRIKCRDYPSTC